VQLDDPPAIVLAEPKNTLSELPVKIAYPDADGVKVMLEGVTIKSEP
jgi:hypothetical protein